MPNLEAVEEHLKRTLVVLFGEHRLLGGLYVRGRVGGVVHANKCERFEGLNDVCVTRAPAMQLSPWPS